MHDYLQFLLNTDDSELHLEDLFIKKVINIKGNYRYVEQAMVVVCEEMNLNSNQIVCCAKAYSGVELLINEE